MMIFEAIGVPSHVYERLEQMNTMPMHGHDSIELIYVIDGACFLHYIDPSQNTVQNTYVKAGNFAIFAPNIMHKWESSQPIHYIVIEFNCLLDNTGVLSYLLNSRFVSQFELSNQLLQGFKDLYIFNDSEDIQHILFKLLRLIKTIQPDNVIEVASYELLLKSLFLTILQCKMENISKSEGNIHINRAYQFFELNFKSKLTLGMLSEFLNITPKHIERLFNETFQTTAMKALAAFRIKKAKILIRNGDYSVKKLALLTGFGTAKSFANNFKAMTGMTPAHYKSTVAKEAHSIILFSEKYQHKLLDQSPKN
jgi:AraC-like DNA-binding protein